MTLPKVRVIRGGSPGSESVLKDSVDWVKQKWNLSVDVGTELYSSITPEQRAKTLIEHLQSDADILWSVRGGEGTTDILPAIEKEIDSLKKASPKMIIGGSDTTALTVYLKQKLNWPTIHGMSFNQVAKTEMSETTQLTKKILLENTSSLKYPLTPLNKSAKENVITEARGCTGGNLSLLAISIKDLWEFNAEDQIIFIEDWNEKAHVIDRSLKYLKRIGKFEKARAIILGDIFFKFAAETPQEIEQQKKYLERQIGFFAESFNIPVFHTDLVGHGPRNHPVPLTWKSSIQGSQWIIEKS